MDERIDGDIHPAQLQELDVLQVDSKTKRWVERKLDLIRDVQVGVSARLGSTQIPISQLFDLREGATLKLDKEVTEPVDLRVEGKTIARGHIVVVGESFGIQITEIVDLD